MDDRRFDALVRALQDSTGSRRRALSALLVALGVPGVAALEAGAERPLDRLRRRTQQRNRKQRNTKKQNKNKTTTRTTTTRTTRTTTVATVRVVAGRRWGRSGSPGACTPNGSACSQEQRVLSGNCFNFVCAETSQPVHRGGHPHRLFAPRHRVLRQRRRLLRRAGHPVQPGRVVLCPQLCGSAVRAGRVWRRGHLWQLPGEPNLQPDDRAVPGWAHDHHDDGPTRDDHDHWPAAPTTRATTTTAPLLKPFGAACTKYTACASGLCACLLPDCCRGGLCASSRIGEACNTAGGGPVEVTTPRPGDNQFVYTCARPIVGDCSYHLLPARARCATSPPPASNSSTQFHHAVLPNGGVGHGLRL